MDQAPVVSISPKQVTRELPVRLHLCHLRTPIMPIQFEEHQWTLVLAVPPQYMYRAEDLQAFCRHTSQAIVTAYFDGQVPHHLEVVADQAEFEDVAQWLSSYLH